MQTENCRRCGLRPEGSLGHGPPCHGHNKPLPCCGHADGQHFPQTVGGVSCIEPGCKCYRPKADRPHPLEAGAVSATEEAWEIMRAERDAASAAKDGAYAERNEVVALLARMALALGWRAGVGHHEDRPGETWDPAWRTIVFIDLPTGQVSWHFWDGEWRLIDDLPAYDAPWDGHNTNEKYRRVNAAQLRAAGGSAGDAPKAPEKIP